MKKIIIGSAAALTAIATAIPASGDTAYMGGLFGFAPDFETITGPNGETCGSDCYRVRYNNFSNQSAINAIDRWYEGLDPGEVHNLYVYSQTAAAYDQWANANPDKTGNLHVVSYAKPSDGAGVEPLTVEADVTYVVVDNDSVADPDGRSFNTHVNGYDNRDFQTEEPIAVEPVGDNERRTYAEPPRRGLFSWLFGGSSSRTTAVESETVSAETVEDELTEAEPTAAEKRAERRAERAEARAERKAERAERRAERKAERAERREARAERRAERRAARDSDE